MAAKSLIKSAPAFSTDDLWQTAERRLDHERRLDVEPALLVTRRDQRLERPEPQGRLADAPAQVGARCEVLRREPAARVPGRDLRADGQDDVFAVSADTGEILWEYKAHLDQTISVVCCGWESRGVALGEGKVYIGQLDGSLVALDQKTGQVAWKTQVARWQDGYSVTAAPLYVNGMVVTGVSGGEFGDARAASPPTTRRRASRSGASTRSPARSDRPRHVAAVERRLEGRRRARLADAVGGSGARDALLHDGQRRPRQQRQLARRQEPLHRVDGRARRADREAQVVVPDGAPRHLGLRRAEPDDPLRRQGRTART